MKSKLFRSTVGAAVAGLMLLAAPAMAAQKYAIDSVHSYVIFKIKHLNIAPNYGRFNDIEGTVSFDEAKPENSKVDITVQTASVDTKTPKRDDHLRSPDFFNAKQFPTITFKSTKVAKTGTNTYAVTGNLNLHGVTKPLTITFTKTGEGKDPWGKYRMGGETTFTIKRSDFGITYMKDGLSDDVTLMLAFEGVRED